jgi:EpsD family peptidyl-prolyl cis-trans isomerase
MRARRLACVLVIAVAAGLAGCQRAEAVRDARVVAKVNGAEIRTHQLPASGAAQALERIIDRELLVQKALEAGLERDPAIAQSIDHARRELLAQAWVERTAGGAAHPTPEEIRAFYAENDALFAGRRIYRLQELVVSAGAEMIDVLRAEAARAEDLAELAAWLHARNARFSEVSLTQPAEQLPLRYLPTLAAMKPGEIAVFGSPLGATVVRLVHAEDAALTEKQAAPLIEQFLAARKRMELAAAEARRLREHARIEYVEEFNSSK